MTVRFYSSVAQQETLTGSISAATTAISVSATTGFPSSTPFTLALDYGAPNEELVDVTAVAGSLLTVTRAVDGTSATSHNAGAIVRHVSSARDFADSRNHENSTNAVHGITGAVVGTTDAQTLTNKTLGAGTTFSGSFTLNNPNITGTVTGGATYNSPTLSGTATVSGNEVVTGTVAATPVLDVKGAASQSGALQRWQDSTAATLSMVDSTGKLFLNRTGAVGTNNAALTPWTITGAAAQTADLLLVRDSASVAQAQVTSTGRFRANKGAILTGEPSPSTGSVELHAGPSSINAAEFYDASNNMVASVGNTGITVTSDIKTTSAIPFFKITNTANIAWTTSTGLHSPSYGNATMTYLYKIVAGVLNFNVTIAFGNTTNFGTSVTTADNWQFALPGAYFATSDFLNGSVVVGSGQANISTAKSCPILVKIDSTGGYFQLDTCGGYQDGTALTNAGTIDSLSPDTWLTTSILRFWGQVPVTPSI